jgi:hypothetical protein
MRLGLWVSEAVMMAVWDKEREWNRSVVISRETGSRYNSTNAGTTADIQLSYIPAILARSSSDPEPGLIAFHFLGATNSDGRIIAPVYWARRSRALRKFG